MRLPIVLFAAGALAARRDPPAKDVRDLPIVRQGSLLLLDGKPWKAVGANVYWLGLDENVVPPDGEPYYAPTHASYPTKGRITEIMATVKAMGGTAIRAHTLGVSTGNPLSVMPTAGKVNEAAFESIDWAVHQAREYGLRLLVPLTDNYEYYHGGKFDFLRWGGFNLTRKHDEKNPAVQNFYTDDKVIGLFKDYIRALLTHINKYTTLSYADDPTIFAYETGNELTGPVWLDMNIPPAWTSEIGAYVKQLAPAKLIVDGTYGVNASHLAVPEVDIVSDHFYPISVDKLKADLSLVVAANKTLFAGEFAWNSRSAQASTDDGSLATFFRTIEQSPAAGGDAFWSMFGHNVPHCDAFVDHSDSLTLQYGNPNNSAFTTSRIQLIRQHLVGASQGLQIDVNATLPVVACPAVVEPDKTPDRGPPAP